MRYISLMDTNVHLILTHSGVFHADEVFACALARLFWGPIRVLRTRDRHKIKAALSDPTILVLDIGEQYDPALLNFDHHGGTQILRKGKWTFSYATFGLLWLYLEKYMSPNLWRALDQGLVAAIDAADHGIKTTGPGFNISTVISHMNPSWKEPVTPEQYSESFIKALDLAGTVLQNTITSVSDHQAAVDMLADAVATMIHPGIVVLDKFVPLKMYDWHTKPTALYAVFPNQGGTAWVVRAIEDRRGPRLFLPAAWRGLHAGHLELATGVEGAEYVDSSGRVGEVKTMEGALELARLATNQGLNGSSHKASTSRNGRNARVLAAADHNKAAAA